MKRRNTPTKDAVLKILTDAGKALSQDTIEKKVELAIDRVTIYRVLNRFCEDGIVHRIVADDGKQYFAICINCNEKKHNDFHFHFRCVQCQTIECLPEQVHFSLSESYKIQGVNCIISGVCKSCTTSQ